MSANLICYDQDVCIPSGGSSGSGQPRPPQQSPGLTPPGRTPTPPGQPRSGSRGSGSSGSGSSSGSKGSGGSGSGGQGGNGNSPIEIDDLIDGLDDPNFWMIQEMKRREAEMLAAMERAARSKKKAYSLLFANGGRDKDIEPPQLMERRINTSIRSDSWNERVRRSSLSGDCWNTCINDPCSYDVNWTTGLHCREQATGFLDARHFNCVQGCLTYFTQQQVAMDYINSSSGPVLGASVAVSQSGSPLPGPDDLMAAILLFGAFIVITTEATIIAGQHSTYVSESRSNSGPNTPDEALCREECQEKMTDQLEKCEDDCTRYHWSTEEYRICRNRCMSEYVQYLRRCEVACRERFG